MWPRDGGVSVRPKPSAAAEAVKGARWQPTAVESLRTHVRSKGAFGMLAVGRQVWKSKVDLCSKVLQSDFISRHISGSFGVLATAQERWTMKK